MPYTTKSYAQQGFTLIQLAIVMVIVGLIVGGVVVGKQTIRNAELRDLVSERERLVTSIAAFKLQYDCYPGDCTNITDHFPSAINGDGNGRIGTWVSDNTSREPYQLFYQLSMAGLISGTYTGTYGSSNNRQCLPGTNVMAAKIDKNVGYTAIWMNGEAAPNDDYIPEIRPTKRTHMMWIGKVQSATCCETYAPFLIPDDAASVDIKVDDGLPATGKWTAAIFDSNTNAYAYNCVTTRTAASSLYNISYKIPACAFAVWDAF